MCVDDRLRPELLDQVGEACLLARNRSWGRGNICLGMVGAPAQLRSRGVLAEALGGRLNAGPLRGSCRLQGIAPDGRLCRNGDLDGRCSCRRSLN